MNDTDTHTHIPQNCATTNLLTHVHIIQWRGTGRGGSLVVMMHKNKLAGGGGGVA